MNLTLVIGAGISGLTAAQHLHRQRQQVRVIDKGRGPGGRLSTRRDGHLRFDHGAQYLTARDPDFAAEVARWQSAGVVDLWNPRLCDIRIQPNATSTLTPRPTQQPRYVGTPGMSAICRHLAAPLDVRFSLRATSLTPTPTGWAVATLREDTGIAETLHAARVIVAIPDAQARSLLQPHLTLPPTTTQPCWAVMAAFPAPLSTPFDAAFLTGSPLAWVAREASKPQRPSAEAWVLHASPDWSTAQLEEPAEAVADSLMAAFADVVGHPLPAPTHLRAHRWRYAQTTSPAQQPCLLNPDRTLGVCGDWLLGGKIEAAYLSGLALAQRLCPP